MLNDASKALRALIAFTTALAGASVHALDVTTDVPEVPLQQYTGSYTPSPMAVPEQKGIYQNGIVVPMVYSPSNTFTYAPQYHVGSGTLNVTPFGVSGSPPSGTYVPSPQQMTPPASHAPVLPQWPPNANQGGAPADAPATELQEPTKPGDGSPRPEGPLTPTDEKPGIPAADAPAPSKCGPIATDDRGPFSTLAKQSIKAHAINHLIDFRKTTVVATFGHKDHPGYVKGKVRWDVGPDCKRTDSFRVVISFFDYEQKRECKFRLRGVLQPTVRDGKKIKVPVFEPVIAPKYCARTMDDGTRVKISAIDGSVFVGDAKDDAVANTEEPSPGQDLPQEPPQEDTPPKEEPDRAARAQAPAATQAQGQK